MSDTANSTHAVRCIWCRRVLTKPESIVRRMGEECAKFDAELTEVLSVYDVNQRHRAAMSEAHDLYMKRMRGA